MIEISGTQIDLNDPLTLSIIAGGAVVLLFLALLIMTVRAAGRSARIAEPLAHNIGILGQQVQQLSAGQEQLRGGLQTVSDTQANAQTQVIQTVEARLASVQQHMQDRLADNAMRSQRSMTEMQERMKESLHGSSKQTTTSLT
ncbi:MAG: DNA recombination protein RmuC, partial [Roseobacter sp.]